MKTYKKNKAVKLSKNFKSTEFDCHCVRGNCRETDIDENLVEILQKIRNHFKKPVTINSGYRCAAHNKNVGGAFYSQHVLGKAADIVVKGIKPLEVAQYCESIGVKGIGLYDTFVHVDTRTKKSFWYSHKQEYRSTFGGLELKLGDKVKLAANAVYKSGKKVPNWVGKLPLYVRGFREDDFVVISILKKGAITGVVHKKYLSK